MKSSELAQTMNQPHSKIKRWAREFLPPDPRAKMRSGYTREYSLDEAFEIIIAGQLVSDMKFEVREAKEIIEALKPFFLYHALYPEMNSPVEIPNGDEGIRDWVIEIIRNPGNNGFELFCLGHVGGDDIDEKGFQTRKFKKEWYHAPEKAQIQRIQSREEDAFVVHRLRISKMRERFLENVRR